ncbi:hypothetical protein PAF17_19175 [Paracoccus sp. Z330]|uniref:Uncharacterized protein n=1 Tax=Paracoccus onchidii TaxID=3017813 RepID=A0ABT4ZJQ4_9RHOB|nr:hypothetical protein [Paracoccus onchidii]MDB6179594.1 hypothetical protein [Paracoccus onchidii]
MACDAEAHWRESSDGNLKRASEYAALADEIGTEIAAILRKHLDGFHS